MNISNIRNILIIWIVISFAWFTPFRKYLTVYANNKSPEIILVLGGDIDRERVGVGLANILKLPLVISGGSNPEHARWLIKQSGIPIDQVKLDYRPQDTFSNFTSFLDDFSSSEFRHVLLVTSKDHLPRAMSVGQVIAGSRGIRLTGISVDCSPNCDRERWQKHFFDSVRALTWVFTGRDLKNYASRKWPKLFKDVNQAL